MTDEAYLYTLHFADDQVVIAQDRDDLEYMSRKLIEDYDKWGLSVNFSKTNYMCVDGLTEDIMLNDGQVIKAYEKYIYLGTKITSSGRTEKEIDSRITKGRRVIDIKLVSMEQTYIKSKEKTNIQHSFQRYSAIWM